MITENKRYVLKKIIKFFENKEFHYKNLYRDAIKQYKFFKCKFIVTKSNKKG